MHVEVYETVPEWTEDEAFVAARVLRKIAITEQDAPNTLPVRVFEALVGCKKNLSTEMAVFNKKGEIYLVRRPSLQENSMEPFPDQWHVPGVTHGPFEWLRYTFKRLEQRELGGVRLRYIFEALPPQELEISPRALCLARIFVGATASEPQNPKGRFFKDIPWTQVISSHRDNVIPHALAHREHVLAALRI